MFITRFGKIHDCEQVICTISKYFYIILYISICIYIFLYISIYFYIFLNISIYFYIFLYIHIYLYILANWPLLAAFACNSRGDEQTDRQERQECGQTNTQKDRQTNSPLYYIYSYISVHIFIYFYIFQYISVYFYIFLYNFIYLYIYSQFSAIFKFLLSHRHHQQH